MNFLLDNTGEWAILALCGEKWGIFPNAWYCFKPIINKVLCAMVDLIICIWIDLWGTRRRFFPRLIGKKPVRATGDRERETPAYERNHEHVTSRQVG